MPRFFVSRAQLRDGRVEIDGDDAAHLVRSLRVVVGEHIRVVDDAGEEHEIVVDARDPSHVSGSVAWSRAAGGEPALRIEVLQALPQSGLEDAIDAMVQVGVVAIQPTITERTVVRPRAARLEHRQRRWNAAAREAASQAWRAALPVVRSARPLGEAVAALTQGTRVVVLDPQASTAISTLRIDARRPVALVIGPEGGLSRAEVARLRDAGADTVHLGPRVLRSRLAGAIAAAMLIANAGDLDPSAS